MEETARGRAQGKSRQGFFNEQGRDHCDLQSVVWEGISEGWGGIEFILSERAVIAGFEQECHELIYVLKRSCWPGH